jgi:hypothetical protein
LTSDYVERRHVTLYILSRVGWYARRKWRVLGRMIGSISTLVTTSLNYRQYSDIADLHTLQFAVAHALGFSVSTSRLLATDLNTETITSNRCEVFLSSTIFPGNLPPRRTEFYQWLGQVKVILCDGQSVSLGVEPHLGPMTRYLLQFDSYGLVCIWSPFLTRGRICVLYMLLALASAVILGSESRGTRDHILLSQI